MTDSCLHKNQRTEPQLFCRGSPSVSPESKSVCPPRTTKVPSRTDVHNEWWDSHRVRSEENSKRPDAVQVRGYPTVRTAPGSRCCGFMEVWGDLGRRTTGRNRQAVFGRP